MEDFSYDGPVLRDELLFIVLSGVEYSSMLGG
jgi:hypothetical protein